MIFFFFLLFSIPQFFNFNLFFYFFNFYFEISEVKRHRG